MYSGAKIFWRKSHVKNPTAARQLNHTLRYLSTARKLSRSILCDAESPETGAGSRTNFQISKAIISPGMPATKNASLQPKCTATCVLRIGPTVKPTNAVALITAPILRPRREGGEDCSRMACMTDQH